MGEDDRRKEGVCVLSQWCRYCGGRAGLKVSKSLAVGLRREIQLLTGGLQAHNRGSETLVDIHLHLLDKNNHLVI